MELTGNTLKDFWIWYLLPEQRKTYKTSSLRGNDNVAKIRFLAMSTAERYGVLVDYFDSVGIYVTEIPHWYKGVKSFRIGFHILKGCVVNSLFVRPGNDVYNFIEFKTRPEARAAAIEKANELRNETLNKQLFHY